MLSSQQHQLRNAGQGSSSSSSGSIPPGALTFTSTDGSGQRYSSPFGDLHLIPPELQTAFVRQMNGGGNPSSGFGGAHAGMQQGESQGSVDTANVFKMPVAGRGVALSGDVSGDEDDEEEGEDGEEGNEDDGGDDDEDEGDDTLGAPSRKRTRTASAKANGAAAAAARIPPRRSSKSSSSTSSSIPAGAGKSAAPPKGKGAEAGESTPKAPSAAKGRAAAASKAAAAAAATTATAGASGSAATKKKSASEVKGERDSLTGRRKIKIQFIEDDSRRHITFSKRKAGIMKKAYELSVLTGTQVLLLIVSQTGLVFTFTTPKLRPVVMETEGRELIQRCLSAPDDEDADEEEEPAEAYAGGDGSDDEDDDELMSMPQSPPMSPSKGPVAILRPGPTMTASGGTPKRSGGGTGDGGAAGRRSRAATMSNATVRQQKNSIGSPEHAVAGLSLPATPATPTAAASSATPSTSASRSKKRRRTHAGGSATPGAGPVAAASPSMMQPPASSALLTAISSPHANSAPLRPGQPLHPQRMQMQQPGQTPNSAPPHFSSLPPDFQPPPHIQQYGGQFHDGKHDGGSSPFLMGPNGGMSSDGMGGQSHNPTEFLFSPVDLSSARSMQQMQQQQQQHLSPFHGGNNTLYSSGSSNPSPNNTLTDGSSGSSSGGPGTGSSSGYSPAMNSNASLFPSFGQVYAGFTGGQQQQQQHVKNGGGSMSSHHSAATLYSPSLGQNASLHHSSQMQQQQMHHQQQLQQQLAQQQQQQQQQQQGSPWGDSMGLPPTPSGGLGLTPQFNSSANGGMSASGSSEFTNSNYWG